MKDTEGLRLKNLLDELVNIQDQELRNIAAAQLKCSINNIVFRDKIKARHKKVK